MKTTPSVRAILVLVIALQASRIGAAGSQPKSPRTERTVPATTPSPFPVTLALSNAGDRFISVRFAGARWPAGTTVHARNLLDQRITRLDAADTEDGPMVVIPAPWDGELKISQPAAPGTVVMPEFIAVVVAPLIPPPEGKPPRLIYGPKGWSSVRFTKEGAPPDGSQIFIVSPPVSAVVRPGRLASDAVEIGLLPGSPLAMTAVVGLRPWSPQARDRQVLNVYDAKRRAWTALPSHADRYGTVFATGPIPGLYAVTAGR